MQQASFTQTYRLPAPEPPAAVAAAQQLLVNVRVGATSGHGGASAHEGQGGGCSWGTWPCSRARHG
eukprot:10789145-Alexandrium_andersonii.AAC.1